MDEQRLMAAFDALDQPMDPDRAFADRLFASLVADLGAGVGAVGTDRRSGGLLDRARRALGLGPVPVGRRALRLAYVAAMLALLVVALAAALFVAGQGPAPATPEELVRLSKAAYQDPPAFSVTYRGPGTEQVLAADGNGNWRVENGMDPDGTYWLWDGTRLGQYDPRQVTWSAGAPTDLGVVAPPMPFGSEVTWGTGEIDGTLPLPVLPCATVAALPDGEVLGRMTDHIVCTDIDMAYWLDRESHLVLRMEAGPTTPHWSGLGPGMEAVMEATAFDLGPQPAADFDWDGPPGAYPPDQAPASRTLAIGSTPPAWEGTTATGDPFRTTDIHGPAVYLVTALWCPPCGPATEAVTAEMADRPGLPGVLVSNDPAGTMVGHYTEHPTTMTLVADEPGGFAAAWGLTAYPTLVLIDEQDKVAAMIRGRIARESVATVLEALEAGEPIPTVPLVTEDVPEPPLPSFTVDGTPRPRILTPDGSVEPVSMMPFGAAMPAFEGPRMGGGRLDSSTLAGRPAVVWFWPGCTNCPTGDLAALDAAADEVGDAVSVVLVVQGEPTPGWTAALFAKNGWDLPVVFDWDNEISTAFGTNILGAQVFDADGRLVDQRVAPPTLDELRSIARTLAFDPGSIGTESPAP